jgi:hypothetical protein
MEATMAHDHRYNDNSLSPLAFLRAVYSDPTVPMHHRMRAAEVAAPYDDWQNHFNEREPSLPGEHRIVIRIECAPELGERLQVNVQADDDLDHGSRQVGHA